MVLLVIAIFGGVFVLALVAIILAARKHMPEILAAQRTFFEQTHYRHTDLPDRPIDEQVRHVPRSKFGVIEQRYVKRTPDGDELRFHASTRHEPGKVIRELTWWMPLGTPARIRLQVADRGLASFGKAARELVTRTSRTWKAVYPGPIALDDTELDRRFLVYAPDADAARRCLADPRVRALLLECAEVDLIVTPEEIRFSDPSDKNMRANRDGAVKRLAAMNAAPTIRASIPVHLRIGEIIERVRTAAT